MSTRGPTSRTSSSETGRRPGGLGLDHLVGADLQTGEAGVERRLAGLLAGEVEVDPHGVPAGGRLGGARPRARRPGRRPGPPRRARSAPSSVSQVTGDVDPVDVRQALDPGPRRLEGSLELVDQVVGVVGVDARELVAQRAGEGAQRVRHVGAGVEVGADQRRRDGCAAAGVAGSRPVAGGLRATAPGRRGPRRRT